MDEPKSPLGNDLVRSNGGFELVLAALFLGVIGWWLDTKLGTTPFLMLALGLLGFVGAGVALYYRFQASVQNLESEKEALGAATDG